MQGSRVVCEGSDIKLSISLFTRWLERVTSYLHHCISSKFVHDESNLLDLSLSWLTSTTTP